MILCFTVSLRLTPPASVLLARRPRKGTSLFLACSKDAQFQWDASSYWLTPSVIVSLSRRPREGTSLFVVMVLVAAAVDRFETCCYGHPLRSLRSASPSLRERDGWMGVPPAEAPAFAGMTEWWRAPLSFGHFLRERGKPLCFITLTLALSHRGRRDVVSARSQCDPQSSRS